MNSKNHIPHGIIKSALALADKLEPLRTKKHPVIAAIAAFALGGVGAGVYMGSIVDFFVPWLILLILMVVGLPLGELPAFFAPCFWGFWAYRRVKGSNARLDAGGNAEGVLEAEVITEPPPIPENQKRISPNSQRPLQVRLSRIEDLFAEGILSKAERDQKRTEILHEL